MVQSDYQLKLNFQPRAAGFMTIKRTVITMGKSKTAQTISFKECGHYRFLTKAEYSKARIGDKLECGLCTIQARAAKFVMTIKKARNSATKK